MLRTNNLPRWTSLHSCVMATWLALYVNAVAEASHITWTAWYNTDTPASGDDDDERVDTIRRPLNSQSIPGIGVVIAAAPCSPSSINLMRGLQICGGYSPINTECRDVDNHTLTFDALSVQLAGDILDEPCTTAGILCRDSDQSKPRKCANYAIRFMCSSIPDRHAPPNIGVIGIAAGLSVFVPIACVAIFHISRVCLRRRRSATEVLVSGNSSSGSCDQADLPPSYSFLFGDTVRSISAIEFPSQNSDTGQSNASFSASVTHLSSGTDSEAYSSIQRGATVLGIHANQSVVSLSPDALPAGRPRFPNMHISIYEIISRPESRESHDVTRPQTPDLSYARTPPPDYKDAVVILGSGEINTNYILDAKEREELH